MDRAGLPSDAELKGYPETVIQDLRGQRDHVCFHREQCDSPSTRQTYTGPLPPGFQEGGFGPGITGLLLGLAYGAKVTPRLGHRFLTHLGVSISVGQVSALLTTRREPFEAELQEAVETGRSAAGWTGLDQTSTRVDGQNYTCPGLPRGADRPRAAALEAEIAQLFTREVRYAVQSSLRYSLGEPA